MKQSLSLYAYLQREETPGTINRWWKTKKKLRTTTKRYKKLYLYCDEIMTQHNTLHTTECSKHHVRAYKQICTVCNTSHRLWTIPLALGPGGSGTGLTCSHLQVTIWPVNSRRLCAPRFHHLKPVLHRPFQWHKSCVTTFYTSHVKWKEEILKLECLHSALPNGEVSG